MATPEAVGEAPQEDAAAKPRQRSARNSGRLLLRMPAGLHEELARAADRSGISLNQFITNVLAGAVGWGRPSSETATSDTDDPARPEPAARCCRSRGCDCVPRRGLAELNRGRT
jgi:HicB family